MRGVFILLSLGLGGCSCGNPSDSTGDDDIGTDGDCSDVDGDGYGIGTACTGSDCDDANAKVWDQDHCDAACDEDPHSTGCECDRAANPEPEICYTGPDGTLSIGTCRAGLRTCTAEGWGSCEGQVVPNENEICDYEDDDCDGEIDEGVRSECGTCSSDCEELTVPGEDGDWGLDDGNSSGVVVDENGDLVLDGTTISLHVIWVANSIDGTLSKIDTRTREETARYATGPLGVSAGLWSGAGDNPSRTSVNYLGDAYVANRAFTGQASVSKFYNTDCPDPDGDGAVDTSSDWDDVLDFGDDECMAWNVDVGGASQLMRSIAVEERVGLDGVIEEYAWAGLCNARRYYEISGEDGALTGNEADVSPCCTYGAAIDKDGVLWSACLSTMIATFETEDPEGTARTIAMPGGNSNYGITLDSNGWVWTGGGSRPCRYRPEDDAWDCPTFSFSSRGIAANADGLVFTHDDSGSMHLVDPTGEGADPDPAEWVQTPYAGRPGRGVAIDFDGLTWFVNWSSGGNDGDISVMDPAAPEDFEACCDTINNSYTYSDMTGFQLRNATNPLGNYDVTFEGCEKPLLTEWTGIVWDATIPAGTSVQWQVRTGDTLAEVNAAAWLTVATDPPDESPFDLTTVPAGDLDRSKFYIQVRVILHSEAREASPALHEFSVQRSCEGVIG